MPDGSYSVSDIQDYFDYIIKKHETIADNSPAQIFVNKIKNRIDFKIKIDYKLELLSKETMQLLGSSKKEIDKNKDGEIVPRLETVEVVLVHCNLVNNNYQQTSKVLFTFVPNKQFGQLITFTPNSLTILKTTNTEFSFVETWFTDQNNRPLEIEDNVSNVRCSLEPKRYVFLSFARKFGDKYGRNLMDNAKKQGINFAKTACKKIVQKSAEATGDLIGNEIADKITSLGKSKNKEKESEINEVKEIYIPPKKKQQIIDDLRLF